MLLKNEKALPFKAGEKIAVIGEFAKKPRYQGAGSSMVNAYRVETPLHTAFDTDIDFVGYAKGYERNGKCNKPLIREAVELAKKSDVTVVYIGLNEIDEMEGNDRCHLKIGDNQVQLIKDVASVVDKLVVIISGGSVVEMP